MSITTTRKARRQGDWVQVIGHDTIGADICSIDDDDGGETVTVHRWHSDDPTVYTVPAVDLVGCRVTTGYTQTRGGTQVSAVPTRWYVNMSREAHAHRGGAS